MSLTFLIDLWQFVNLHEYEERTITPWLHFQMIPTNVMSTNFLRLDASWVMLLVKGSTFQDLDLIRMLWNHVSGLNMWI